jgi:hypothetical protein
MRNLVPAGQAHPRAKLSCGGLPGRAQSGQFLLLDSLVQELIRTLDEGVKKTVIECNADYDT